MWRPQISTAFSRSQTGESTPGITGWLEVEVNGTLVHSKKVGIGEGDAVTEWAVLCNCVCVCMCMCVCVTVQNGDGYVDSEAKLKKIKDAIEAALK